MTNHRVWPLTDVQRGLLVSRRESDSTTNERLVDAAVETMLPGLVEKLLSCGFQPQEPTRPARLPISDEALAALREAAELTGLPQTTLFCLALLAYCREGEEAAPVAPPAPPAAKPAPKRRAANKAATETKGKAATTTTKRKRAAKTTTTSRKGAAA